MRWQVRRAGADQKRTDAATEGAVAATAAGAGSVMATALCVVQQQLRWRQRREVRRKKRKSTAGDHECHRVVWNARARVMMDGSELGTTATTLSTTPGSTSPNALRPARM